MSRRWTLTLLLAAIACGQVEPAPPAPRPASAEADAAPRATAIARPATAPAAAIDPSYHLDPDPVTHAPRRTDARTGRHRSIELIIRSTPPGATASVDGRPIGKTPTYWEGLASGQAHEFTFALPGYAVARYRFVPTQSGIVHGSLTRLVTATTADKPAN